MLRYQLSACLQRHSCKVLRMNMHQLITVANDDDPTIPGTFVGCAKRWRFVGRGLLVHFSDQPETSLVKEPPIPPSVSHKRSLS